MFRRKTFWEGVQRPLPIRPMQPEPLSAQHAIHFGVECSIVALGMLGAVIMIGMGS